MAKKSSVEIVKSEKEVKLDMTEELFKVWSDVEYFAEKYCTVWHKQQAKRVPFKLLPTQRRVLKGYDSHNKNLVLKYRQGGISTVTELYLAHLIISVPDVKIAVVANNIKLARKFLKETTDFVDNLPSWFNIRPIKNASEHKIYNNKTEIMALAASGDGVRGWSCDYLVIDEAAYLQHGANFWVSARGSMSAGGKIFMISCVTDDTFVFTNEGIKQVKDFIKPEKEGGYVIDKYSILGKDKTRSSNIMFNNGICETIKITTPISQVESSLPHKWWSFSKEKNEYGWYETKDLNVGDYIAYQYGMEIWGNNDNVSDFNPTTYKIINHFKPNKITKELAYFLGLFIAEGYANKKNGCIIITCGDDISESLNVLNLPFKLQKDGVHYSVCSRNLIEFFEYLGFDLSLKAPKKYIPSRLLKMSRENIIELVKGMMDGDGCIEKKRTRISYTSTSELLIDQLRHIFNNFGIITNKEKHITKPTKKVKVFSTRFVLYGINENLITYCEKIGFGLERKYKIAIEKLNSNLLFKKSSQDLVLKGKIILKDISEKYKIYGSSLDKTHKDHKRFIKLLNNKNFLINDCNSYNFFEIYKQIKHKLNDEEIAFIDSIISPNIKWTPITNLENSENYTFDFSLPNEENDLTFCHSVIYNCLIGHQTPNGNDEVYYTTYEGAINKRNDFNVIHIRWWEDSRFNTDLRFKLLDEYVDDIWIKDRNGEKGLDLVKCFELIQKGYQPTSTWYENETAGYDYDPKRIAQELECSFVGSGGNLINQETIESQEKNNVKPPIKCEYRDKNFWIWKEPEPDRRYVMGVDGSSGNSEDFSGIQIIDIDSGEQVAEYQGRIKPEELGDMVFHYASRYNYAFVVMDITGGSGAVPMLILLSRGYKNVYYTESSNKAAKEKLESFVNNEGKTPGFLISSNRAYIIADFEVITRKNDFKIRSTRLMSEIKTFVWINGRYDHGRVSHDDLLFAAIIAFAGLNKLNQNGLDAEKARQMAAIWNLNNQNPNKESEIPKRNPNAGIYTSPFGNNRMGNSLEKYGHLIYRGLDKR